MINITWSTEARQPANRETSLEQPTQNKRWGPDE